MELSTFYQYFREMDTPERKKITVLLYALVFTVAVLLAVLYGRSVQETSRLESLSVRGEYLTFIEKERREETAYRQKIKSFGVKVLNKKDIDAFQNQLIKKMQVYKLDAQSVNASSRSITPPNNGEPPPPPVAEYEVIVTGSWENTMKYLEELAAEPVLINLTSVRMDADSESSLKTVFRYKIYYE